MSPSLISYHSSYLKMHSILSVNGSVNHNSRRAFNHKNITCHVQRLLHYITRFSLKLRNMKTTQLYVYNIRHNSNSAVHRLVGKSIRHPNEVNFLPFFFKPNFILL